MDEKKDAKKGDKKKPIRKKASDMKPKAKDVPIGDGLADRAKGAIINRKKMLDEI
jgi:hypothetical protein